MSRDVILTGLRANNELHIGNYLGALLPIVDMAKNKSSEYQVNLFVPDLHSFTTPIDHSKLQEQIKQNLRVFAAAGLPLDNDNVNLYRQSYIPAHSELTIILNSFTSSGEMNRMTQYRSKAKIKESFDKLADKVREATEVAESTKGYLENATRLNISVTSTDLGSAIMPTITTVAELITGYRNYIKTVEESFVSVGLFDYPVLMAADILLYGAKYVPVGDDQTQHLEFTRDIAERMNKKFGELFVIPEPVKKQHEFFGKDQGLRIKDLQDPSKKMSKSADSDKGIIFMTDSPEDAKKKIMSAETDNLAKVAYDPENQPGISNLLQIHALLSGQAAEQSAQKFAGQTKYGEFKAEVAEVVAKFLIEFQDELSKVDDNTLIAKLESSEKSMNEVAQRTLAKVQKAVGLR